MEDSVYQDKYKAKNKNKRKLIILILCGVVLLIVGFILFVMRNYYKDLTTVTYDNYEVYQYFSGVKVEYNGKVTISRDGDITEIESEGKHKIDSGNVPIYFQKINNEVMFPVDMELVFVLGNNDKLYKLNYFTKMTVDKTNNDESAYLDQNDMKKYLEQCFLYDGDNLYFFPYSTVVTVDGVDYNLSPLSYAIVNYKGEVEIYNKEMDEYTVIDSYENDVTAVVQGKTVNLSTDMIINKNDNRLLIKNVKKLETYK